MMSKALEQDRSWGAIFKKYGGTQSFETYEAIAEASGHSSKWVSRVAIFGKYAGPAGVATGVGVGAYHVYKAPEAERPRVAMQEAGGVGGGAVGVTVGTGLGTATAGGIAGLLGLSGPPGWLVLALGIGGGLLGGFGGSEGGKRLGGKAVDLIEDAAKAEVDLNQRFERAFTDPSIIGGW
jgi:hypothetical protein